MWQRLAWLTDIHLNFLHPLRARAFLASPGGYRGRCILDRGRYRRGNRYLTASERLGSSVAAANLLHPGQPRFLSRLYRCHPESIRNLCWYTPNLHWMPDAGVIPLTDNTASSVPTAGAMDGTGIITIRTLS